MSPLATDLQAKFWHLARVLPATALMVLAFAGTRANSQTAPEPTPSNRPAVVPEWQKLAGGKMCFDVASIRQGKPGNFVPPNFALSADNSYAAIGGRFSADFPLETYITFAYKLWPSPDQQEAMVARLPQWVTSDQFVIEARGPVNATKDQMRLMMQCLLADRFQLAVHFETKETSVLALVLEKEGKLGPKLLRHEDGRPCDVHSGSETKGPQTGPDQVFPPVCDGFMGRPGHQEGQFLAGSRNTTMPLIASFVALAGHFGRPVVDQTGLTGRFDFTVEFTRETGLAAQPGTDGAPDSQGPTLLEALKAQLGLKLIRTRAPVETLVIDHIEKPSEN